LTEFYNIYLFGFKMFHMFVVLLGRISYNFRCTRCRHVAKILRASV